jgi:peptidoglycan/LPS O-acetylase OafA/YrhL
MSIKYRADIDGLRSLAIIPVLMFHAHVPFFGGGYVGVDVFFVISGFLITSILMRDIEAGNFSIATFYERRVRRIFPALFCVMLVTMAAGALMLLPDDFNDLGKSLFASAMFGANWYFMADTGYFAGPADTKPLLHMWSLAVEEQYYILFPLYLYWVMRHARNLAKPLTWLLLALSFAGCVYVLNGLERSNWAFFSTPTRAWELLAGAMLALYPRHKPLPQPLAETLALAGTALLGFAVFSYTDHTVFPGLAAVPPVLGAALLIYTGGFNKTLVSRVLASRPLVFTGLISYSLYLWHWPVIVMWHMKNLEGFTAMDRAGVIAVSVLLAILTWRFVERPFRAGKMQFKGAFLWRGAIISVFCMLLFAGMGAGVALLDGLPQRYPAKIIEILAARDDGVKDQTCTQLKSTPLDVICDIGDVSQAEPSFILWSDSHGDALVPAINIAAIKAGKRGVVFYRPGCVPLLDVWRVTYEEGRVPCDVYSADFKAYLEQHPNLKTVIMAGRWAQNYHSTRYKREPGGPFFIQDAESLALSEKENGRVFKRGFRRALAFVHGLGRRIVIIAQVPETTWNMPEAAARQELEGRDLGLETQLKDYTARQAEVTKLFAESAKEYPITFVHPEKTLCGKKGPCRVFDDKGMPAYKDNNHLKASFAATLWPIFTPVFSQP